MICATMYADEKRDWKILCLLFWWGHCHICGRYSVHTIDHCLFGWTFGLEVSIWITNQGWRVSLTVLPFSCSLSAQSLCCKRRKLRRGSPSMKLNVTLKLLLRWQSSEGTFLKKKRMRGTFLDRSSWRWVNLHLNIKPLYNLLLPCVLWNSFWPDLTFSFYVTCFQWSARYEHVWYLDCFSCWQFVVQWFQGGVKRRHSPDVHPSSSKRQARVEQYSDEDNEVSD